MTVKELIEKLQECDENAEVKINTDNYEYESIDDCLTEINCDLQKVTIDLGIYDKQPKKYVIINTR